MYLADAQGIYQFKRIFLGGLEVKAVNTPVIFRDLDRTAEQRFILSLGVTLIVFTILLSSIKLPSYLYL